MTEAEAGSQSQVNQVKAVEMLTDIVNKSKHCKDFQRMENRIPHGNRRVYMRRERWRTLNRMHTMMILGWHPPTTRVKNNRVCMRRER